MRGFANVFRLEFRLRRAVFPAALVTGLIPIPMALLITQGSSFSVTVDVGAAACALIGGVLLALYLGATVLCQDLSEGRQGFYLSRPVGALALWAGRFSAAWAVVLGAMLVCLLPATFLGGGLAARGSMPNPFSVYDLGPQELSPLWTPVLAAFFLLTLMAMAHALSVMFRARSLWLILDGAMVVLLPALSWWALRLVLIWESEYLFLVGLVILGVGTLVGLTAAGGAQTTVGRADLKRGHRALSLTLWSLLGLTVLAVDVHALWATSVSPSDLTTINKVERAPEGPWIAISGYIKHLGPHASASFLANGQSGKWFRLPPSRWGGPVLFSPKGRLAVFYKLHTRENQEPSELISINLAGEGTESTPTGILLSAYPTLAFAPDGSRLAVLSGTNLSIYDLPDWKLVAAKRIERPVESLWCSLYFLDRDTLRLCLTTHEIHPATINAVSDLWEFAIPSCKLTKTGALVNGVPWSMQLNATGDRMLVYDDKDLLVLGSARLLLCDARTGEIIRQLAVGKGLPRARFLWDGRILVSKRLAPRSFTLYSSEGVELRVVDIEEGMDISIRGPQVSASKILAHTWAQTESDRQIRRGGDVSILDLDTGAVQVLQGMKEPDGFWNPSGPPRLAPASENASTQLFLDSQGKLVRYDFKTRTASPVKF